MTPEFITRTYWLVQNRAPSQDEINFHMAKSNPTSFVNGFGDQPLWRQQQAQVDAMQNTINQLNQTVTSITQDDMNDKAAVQKGVEQIALLTTQLETAHDQIKDLQNAKTSQVVEKPAPSSTPEPTEPDEKKPSLFVRLLAKLLTKKA